MYAPSCAFDIAVEYFTSFHRASSFFFFNDPATTEIYTLSLHDALPIYDLEPPRRAVAEPAGPDHRSFPHARGHSGRRAARRGRVRDSRRHGGGGARDRPGGAARPNLRVDRPAAQRRYGHLPGERARAGPGLR